MNTVRQEKRPRCDVPKFEEYNPKRFKTHSMLRKFPVDVKEIECKTTLKPSFKPNLTLIKEELRAATNEDENIIKRLQEAIKNSKDEFERKDLERRLETHLKDDFPGESVTAASWKCSRRFESISAKVREVVSKKTQFNVAHPVLTAVRALTKEELEAAIKAEENKYTRDLQEAIKNSEDEFEREDLKQRLAIHLRNDPPDE
ncbi:hypothetical protein AKO1_005830, partial [Acrasis kona]